MNFSPILGVGLVAALAWSNGPALSQSQPSENAAPGVSAQDAAPEIPAGLVDRALAGEAEALVQIRRFLAGPGVKSPDTVTQRATQLISQIGRQKSGVPADDLLRLVDQIAGEAIDLISGSQVVRIGVDRDFVPTRALVAWDFGPADGEVAPGFERVLPNDGRIGGADLDGLRRPAESELLNDGIAGVERIEADLPDGEYRIILMTQNLGDRQLMSNPFGQEVVVNGTSLTVTQPDPDQWLRDAVLSNRGLQDIAARPGAPGSPAAGFGVADLGAFDPGLFQRQQGGAIIVTATARGGKLIIELKGFQNARSYLTGLLVEPAQQTSELILSQQATQALAPPELRLALEENILAAAADVLADIDPAEGDPELVELPEPILDPEELASTSS